MGCCISSNKKIPHQPKPPVMEEPGSNNRSPPPPYLEEEEAVKEVVVSETPLPKPQQNPKENTNTTEMATIQELNMEAEEKEEEEEEGDMSRALSQVSEIYSIGESLSTATTATTTTTTTVALTDIKDDDEAISKTTNRDLGHSSPAKVPRKRPIAGGAKSPAKRADSLRVMSRPVPGRTVPHNLGPTGVRRGGSSSSRWMRSPGACGVGNVTTGRAGGKLRVEKETKINNGVNDGVLVEKSELNESLNNPRVSLECFIFL